MNIRLTRFKTVGAGAAENTVISALRGAVRSDAGSAAINSAKSSMRCAISSAAGSAVAEVVIMAAMLVFVIFPVFSAVMERFIVLDKARLIRDSVDMTNISVYDALNTASLGKVSVDLFDEKAGDIFQELLRKNLKLDSGMMPRSDSVAEGRVEILSLVFYKEGFPAVCPNGSTIERPSVHSCIDIPIKPSLYRGIILNLLGRDHVDVIVHVDSEIPVNN